MSERDRSSGLPIGAPLPGWTGREPPPRTTMRGRYCRVEVLDVDHHAADLFEANSDDPQGRNWTYLATDAPADLSAYRDWLLRIAAAGDPLFHAIVDISTERPVGVAAYLRIDPPNGVIEVGHLNFSPRMQRTRMATESMYLMMRRAFDELGYRRYEWKCDNHNAPSHAAAKRYGFQFEGVFRQAIVTKQRNRDSAWYSIIDAEWPAVRAEFERWLDPANFDSRGQQRSPLAMPGR
ncbi:MAG: GNAT family protein [Tahibacter sp.]